MSLIPDHLHRRSRFSGKEEMLLSFIVWPIWFVFLMASVVYIPGIELIVEISDVDINTAGWFPLLAICVSMVAIIEAALSVLIRHLVIVKPAKQDTFRFNTVTGGLRFVTASMLNWFLAATISNYGIVLYVMSENTVFLYVFGLAGLGLIIFHAPLFTRYENAPGKLRA